MSATPNMAATPRLSHAQIATANTNRDGTGTVGTVFTAGSSGSRIDQIHIKAQVTTTNGMIRLFIHDGSVYRLWKEVPVTAATVSATVPAYNQVIDLTYQPLILPNGHSLRASTHNAETFNVIAMGGDF